MGIRLAALWNKKAGEWIYGRKALFENLERTVKLNDNLIWMHCSSAGEFEQGKPLIEALKKEYPVYKILVSFFSPSGFATAQHYKHADYITYLPLDTKRNAERFIKIIKPALVIFVKYEFWYYHLSQVACKHIPLLLVSAVFRKDQAFFKSYGRFFRKILFLFRQIFVQDEASLQLLKENGIEHCIISGDTRFDRVAEIRNQFSEINFIREFTGDKSVIVAGSTWPDDETLIARYLKNNAEIKLVLAPHEVNATHISSIKNLFPDHILYSEIASAPETQNKQVLIIDSVGLLSRLYHYATISYIGGGFTKDGIHNILEAAVWGKPVIFGPNYKKYREAGELIEVHGGFSISTTKELEKLAGDLFINKKHLQAVGDKARYYIEENTGATTKIIRYIQEKRLLTKL